MKNNFGTGYGHEHHKIPLDMEVNKQKLKAMQDGDIKHGSSVFKEGLLSKIIMYMLGIGFVFLIIYALFFW